MTRFKFLRGKETELPNILVDGNIYFCTDSGKFFVDYLDKDGTVVRKQVAAEYAEKLKIIEENEENEIGAKEILERIDNKVDREEGKGLSTHDFNDTYYRALQQIMINFHTLDTELSTTSTNPVQNKVVTAEINKKMNIAHIVKDTENKEVYQMALDNSVYSIRDAKAREDIETLENRIKALEDRLDSLQIAEEAEF